MSADLERHRAALQRGATVGVVGGIVGAAVMAMYAMVVSAAVKDVGFFTPLYHIASAFISPTAMMTSMGQAAHGDSIYFTAGPAIVGLIVHMMTGAVAGGVFGALVGWIRPARTVTVAAGAAFGLLVMVLNAFIGLPIVAGLFGGGKPISDMPTMVGWGTFTIEHLLFGLVLGAVVALKVAGPSFATDRPLAARAARTTAEHRTGGRRRRPLDPVPAPVGHGTWPYSRCRSRSASSIARWNVGYA